jgi:hypothetical protein
VVWSCRVASGPDCLGADSLQRNIKNWRVGGRELARVGGIVLEWVWLRRIACGPDCLGADSLHVYITNWRMVFSDLARSALLLGWRGGGMWFGGAKWQVANIVRVPILCIPTSKIGVGGLAMPNRMWPGLSGCRFFTWLHHKLAHGV